jgi:hypothetical protein
MAGQLVSLGGNGAGQFLAAAAVALLLRLFSGPGPALMPEDESPDDKKTTQPTTIVQMSGKFSRLLSGGATSHARSLINPPNQ